MDGDRPEMQGSVRNVNPVHMRGQIPVNSDRIFCRYCRARGANVDKTALRSVLKSLRAIPFDRGIHANVMMVPQEMLDFLAMLAGIKPVFLLGRGFDDPQWVHGLTGFARKKGLQIIEGPAWHAKPVDATLPSWFCDHIHASLGDMPVFYICRTRSTAAAVQAAIDNPPIAIDEEARLLGYPSCCVRAHYERQSLFNRAFYMFLKRTGGGDITEMQRILREDIEMSPQTPEEQAAAKQAMAFTPAPFTSFHMCNECAADPSRPAAALSKRYEQFARAVDEGLALEIAVSQQGVGRYD